MIEMWRRCLDDDKMVGTTLMVLSEAFDCLPHQLFFAKLNAYGFDKKALKLILSYLSGRKQCVKSGGCLSMLELILESHKVQPWGQSCTMLLSMTSSYC